MQAKRVAFGRILEQRVQCIKMAGTSQRRNVAMSRCPHVVTSQRRDVGSTYTEVNVAATSRRLNVAATSRRLNVAGRRQHGICLSIFKCKKGTIIRGDRRSRNVRTRARKSQQQDFDLGEEPSFCIFFFSD